MTELYQRRQLNKAAKLLNEGNIQGFKILEELVDKVIEEKFPQFNSKGKTEIIGMHLEELEKEVNALTPAKP